MGCKRMQKYFKADKLGLKNPLPTDDAYLYKVTSVTNNVTASAGASSAGATTSSTGKGKGKSKSKKSKSKSKKKARKSKRDSASATDTDGSSDEESPSTTKKPVPTGFYADLQTLQERYYMHMRASLPLHMNDPAKNYYHTVLAREDLARNLAPSEKYKQGRRIPWEWIKNMVYDDICCPTNGNYYTRPMLTVYRRAKQTRFEWCQQVLGVQEDVEKFGRGYDKIGTWDAVEKLWDWFMYDEQAAIRKYYKDVHIPRYITKKEILLKVNLRAMIKATCEDIKRDEFPKTEFDPICHGGVTTG